jgi:hypothetical protein
MNIKPTLGRQGIDHRLAVKNTKPFGEVLGREVGQIAVLVEPRRLIPKHAENANRMT